METRPSQDKAACLPSIPPQSPAFSNMESCWLEAVQASDAAQAPDEQIGQHCQRPRATALDLAQPLPSITLVDSRFVDETGGGDVCNGMHASDVADQWDVLSTSRFGLRWYTFPANLRLARTRRQVLTAFHTLRYVTSERARSYVYTRGQFSHTRPPQRCSRDFQASFRYALAASTKSSTCSRRAWGPRARKG